MRCFSDSERRWLALPDAPRRTTTLPPVRSLTPQNRELFMNLARREIRGRYKGSWLGVLWTLVIPLLMMLSYTLIFSVIFQVVDIPHYPLFLMTGLALWVFFGNSIVVAATSLLGNADLIKKVKFPREVVPLAAISSQAITAAVMLAILIPLNVVFMPGSRWTLVLLPVGIIASCALVLGLSFALSVINVYFRDTEHIISALLLPWFFITPILYTYDSFPLATSHEWVVTVLETVNFATPFVLFLQDVLFWGRWPQPWVVAYVLIAGAVFLALGYWVFRKLQRDLAVEL